MAAAKARDEERPAAGTYLRAVPKTSAESVLGTSDLSAGLCAENPQSDNARSGERDVRMETAPATANTSVELRPGPGGAGLKDGAGDAEVFVG